MDNCCTKENGGRGPISSSTLDGYIGIPLPCAKRSAVTWIAARRICVMLDKALVAQKLAFLIEHLDELEPLSTAALEEYKTDAIKRHATEKLVELVVGYATDI